MLNEPVDAPGAGPQENPLTEAQGMQLKPFPIVLGHQARR